MAEQKEKKEKGKKKARKKALGLAAVATAAAVTPAAAEVVVQKTEAPQVTRAPEIEVPQPPRYEYSKPRPLKTIGDLLKGIFGVGTARAEAPTPRLPIIGVSQEIMNKVNELIGQHRYGEAIGVLANSGLGLDAVNRFIDGLPFPLSLVREPLKVAAAAYFAGNPVQPPALPGFPATAPPSTPTNPSAPFGGPLAPSQPAATPESSVYGTPEAIEAQTAIAQARLPNQATKPAPSQPSTTPNLPPGFNPNAQPPPGAPSYITGQHWDPATGRWVPGPAQGAYPGQEPSAQPSGGAAGGAVDVEALEQELATSQSNQTGRGTQVAGALQQAASFGITVNNNPALAADVTAWEAAEDQVDADQEALQGQIGGAQAPSTPEPPSSGGGTSGEGPYAI